MNHSVVSIIKIEDKFLIGKKIKKDGHFLCETWHIPGGKAQENEDVELALKREAKEETNLNISAATKIATVINLEKDLTIHWYLCETLNTDYIASSDLSEIKLVHPSKIWDECGEVARSLWPDEVKQYFATLTTHSDTKYQYSLL